MSSFPSLKGRVEYSFETDGPMTIEQLDQWLAGLREGYAVPGALQWLADSYRAFVEAAKVATETHPEGHENEGAWMAAWEYERLDGIGDLVEKVTK